MPFIYLYHSVFFHWPEWILADQDSQICHLHGTKCLCRFKISIWGFSGECLLFLRVTQISPHTGWRGIDWVLCNRSFTKQLFSGVLQCQWKQVLSFTGYINHPAKVVWKLFNSELPPELTAACNYISSFCGLTSEDVFVFHERQCVSLQTFGRWFLCCYDFAHPGGGVTEREGRETL